MNGASARINRLCDLLLVGHGGALLLIFNARAHDPSIANLRTVAWPFAMGLVLAFVCVFLIVLDEQAAEHRTKQDLGANQNKDREQMLSGCLIASMVAFVAGLLGAINLL